MDYLVLAIEACLLLISVYAYLVYWKYKDFPPGPYGIPLLGYAPFLGAKPHVTLRNLSRKYGSTFSVNLAGQQTVVVNDWQGIKEVLVKQGDAFSNRPFMYMFHVILQGRDNDIVATSGPVQKELKRTTIQILKTFGMGRSSIESVVVEEVEKLVTHLKTLDGQLVDMSSVLFIPIMNIIWGITAGTTFDITDPDMQSFVDALQTVLGLNNVGILNMFPMLRFVAPEFSGNAKLEKASRKLNAYVEQVVDQHFKEGNDGQQTDLIHAFIDELKDRRKDQPPFNKNNVVGVTMDMFSAGAEPVNTTLHWAFLLMAYYPDIQKKVQRELDERIAIDSHLSYSSKSMIPYTEATLCEINRFVSSGTLAVPHCTSRDATLLGYKIPEGTTVLTNLWALHHDQEYWGDPDEFRPERFLDEAGRLKKHDRYIPFGAGQRACPGEPMAKLELILFFSGLMRRFSFDMDPNRPSTSESPLEPIVGLDLRPRCASLLMKCR